MLTTQRPSDVSSQGNALNFALIAMLRQYAFIDVVKVVDVDYDAETLTALCLIQDTDSSGNPIDNARIYDVPWIRLQGGNSAVVIDPRVGDIGMMLVCDRDITNAKETKGGGTAPTKRIHSRSDAIYLTGIALLNGAPSEYVKFTGNGIEIVSTGVVSINGLQVLANGQLRLTNGVIVDTHVHGGVESGGSTTSGPE